MEAIEKVVFHFKGCDIGVGVLIDGILYAFNEQTIDSDVVMMLNGFGTVVNSLGKRMKPHFPQICDTLNQRLNSQSEKFRKQSADLISRIAVVIKQCEMDRFLDDLCTLFFERLELEYAEVQDSFLEALNSIINVIGVTKMTLPMNDLVVTLNRLLDNVSHKVQEVCINILGMIACDRGNYVSETNWMMTCFKICEKFMEPKKVIRTAAINTFGMMVKVKAVSPPKIIPILMDNLVTTDRRVCIWSTVAIAIVAEVHSRSSDLVLIEMMNKYYVSDRDVQCRVLKSLAFVFEYVGDLDKAYISAVTPLLEHALKDTNAVQRYLAVSAVTQMTLKAVGLGVDDLLIHLLNHVWPNILDMDSPIVMKVVMEAIDAMRKALGSSVILNHCVQGMFHPARRVRDVYWMIYNSVYVADQDALVPSYPSFSNRVGQELQIFI
ncbi:splicing factor 3B subunit 1-like [Trifolium medium]|nr:splicing factor 3B subunit 1-like [Trifolium medium]